MQQPNPDVKLIFIARRHWKMGGTRYNARGLDEDANVANHTETEQLVIIHNKSDNEEEQGGSSITSTTKVYSYV